MEKADPSAMLFENKQSIQDTFSKERIDKVQEEIDELNQSKKIFETLSNGYRISLMTKCSDAMSKNELIIPWEVKICLELFNFPGVVQEVAHIVATTRYQISEETKSTLIEFPDVLQTITNKFTDQKEKTQKEMEDRLRSFKTKLENYPLVYDCDSTSNLPNGLIQFRKNDEEQSRYIQKFKNQDEIFQLREIIPKIEGKKWQIVAEIDKDSVLIAAEIGLIKEGEFVGLHNITLFFYQMIIEEDGKIVFNEFANCDFSRFGCDLQRERKFIDDKFYFTGEPGKMVAKKTRDAQGKVTGIQLFKLVKNWRKKEQEISL